MDTFQRGDRVMVDDRAPRAIGPVQRVRTREAVVVHQWGSVWNRHSDLWVVRYANGQEQVASGSLLTKIDAEEA